MDIKEIKPYIEHRPWGSFTQFVKNRKATVKILTLKRSQELSLQYHNYREEFWVVLEGKPRVRIGNKVKVAKSGDIFSVPKKAIHRVAGGKSGAKLLEISFGKFNENDIIRVEDRYGRLVNSELKIRPKNK